MDDAKHKSTKDPQHVINLLESHKYAARGVRGSKWAMLVGSTAMAGGALSHVMPAADDVIPDTLPIGGAVVAALAEVNRRGNRWMMNINSKELSGLGIAPPKAPSGTFANIRNGTQYVPPSKHNAYWTVIYADKETQPTSPGR